ncbi:F-box/kelch-repeat protein At3g23880-like [Rhododendron vialii]|uniref:F-box/kelch-repeat protein At3g23880-like n=1 Tax=Rhododendron vialii TaxID=182163 RepID=UPI0026604313|nr:F-box/kelch-repeat protein At3g23880-like [Rhododendron vialii]
MADHIHNDLLIEILARLPVASLLQFKSVCKTWYSLITSPSFVTKHLDQSITNTKRNGSKIIVRVYGTYCTKERYLLLDDDDDQFGDEYSELEVPFELLFGCFRIVGSCNGLLCVLDYYFIAKCQIIIWNPSTRKSEYKVIRLEYEWVEWDLKLPPKVEIYTQGTRLWRGISSAAPSYGISMRCQAFVDGAVHWVAYEPCVGGGVRNLIMLFNMASESFSEFKLPPTLAYQPPPSLSIKKLGQSMAVVCSGPRDSSGCCIWLMKEYGVAESWTKLFSSNLLGRPNRTLGFRKKGEVLLATDKCLASYAPGTNTLATTGFRGNSPIFYIYQFMETLVLV